MHATVVLRYLESSTVMIAPVCPHFAENIWQVNQCVKGAELLLLHNSLCVCATAPIDDGEAG
jgi:leucyl-tRNA synthetase